MNYDQILIERTGYTIMDFLSDVGGLQGILISAVSVTLSILNHNYLDNYLVSKLYKSDSIALMASSTDSIREFCFSNCMLRRLSCCRKKRKQVAIEHARSSLEKEIDIVKLIRSQRFV